MHIFGHLRTITKHHNRVMKYCFKCGLYFQGFFHDLSKLSFPEFFNGAKYYQGTYSPNYNERKAKGYSEMPVHGWIPVTVPGAVSGWVELSKRFGKLEFEELFEPAIDYAQNGVTQMPPTK